ncbi:MAG: hypothetical protein BGO67_06245 [Alphaproteobacteria bacterium 41-28]|nr:MAG: hypothetical protein BGO67_06245 [Alphaproteobacteria bacterium 41-28]
MKLSKIILISSFLNFCINGNLQAMETLPEEILVNIASKVSKFRDNRNLSFVSRKWKDIANDDPVIRHLETDLSHRDANQQDSERLKKLLQTFPACVKKLDLSFVDLDRLRENFYLSHLPPFLTELHLGNTYGCEEDVSDSDIIHVVANCPHLQILHLTSLNKVTKEGLCALRSLTRLEKLELYFMPNIKSENVAECLPSLQEWNINGTTFLRSEQGTHKESKNH